MKEKPQDQYPSGYYTMRAYADCHGKGEYDYRAERSVEGYSRNLEYRSPGTVSVTDAVAIMKAAIGSGYNEFKPELLRLLPKQARVRLAREGSVCVYVETISDGLEELQEKMKADEFDKTETTNGVNTYRIWWD